MDAGRISSPRRHGNKKQREWFHSRERSGDRQFSLHDAGLAPASPLAKRSAANHKAVTFD
jgi:hypothetical protein